ncbi:hypothetical protein [Piscinibacter sp. XHJ-5]|uniref:hypothetical protein n=1 Tax=Piscinibacter sp. XHJ-5 TaxID=3037797 RepID=UPI002452BE19|nr:hypothetical protein [Piscinibacter sp. XHJ-5]
MKPSLRRYAVDALWSGTLASLASGAVLAWRGRAENASAAAPLNAPAHWFFGDESLRQDEVSWKHTATGLVTHHMSSVFWAALHQLLLARHRRVTPARVAGDAVAVTAIAAVVDLKLVPRRLTPGFERRLSRPSLAGVYVGFAAGLALGACARMRR